MLGCFNQNSFRLSNMREQRRWGGEGEVVESEAEDWKVVIFQQVWKV